MKTYRNPYLRLQTYYNCLRIVATDSAELPFDSSSDDDIYFSLERLHKITEIPLSIVRKDICSIFQWQSNLEVFYKSTKYDYACYFKRDSKFRFLENSTDNSLAFLPYSLDELQDNLENSTFLEILEHKILSGALDFVPLVLEEYEFPRIQLPLSTDEAEALQTYQSSGISLSKKYKDIKPIYQTNFRIKDSYLFNHNYNTIDGTSTLNNKLEKLNQAINNHTCLRMQYKNAKKEILTITFRPSKIAYDSTENLYSVLSVYKGSVQVHRLDQILSLEKSNEKLEIEDTSILDKAPNVWGCCFSDKPEQVKVRFYQEANVFDKVEKDLAYRTNKKLYKKDGFLYYEDTVYGISKFRNWIYGFGSSAIVLEPRSLREQIIDSLKKRREL